MTQTENLKLFLSGVSDEDLIQTFLDWRLKMNGEGNDSNMEVIDAAYAELVKEIESRVKTINGKNPNTSGAVTLTASDVGARPSTWLPTLTDIGAMPATISSGTKGNVAMIDSSGNLTTTNVAASDLNGATLTKMSFNSSTKVLTITTI